MSNGRGSPRMANHFLIMNGEELQQFRETLSPLVWGSFPHTQGGVESIISIGQLHDGRTIKLTASMGTSQPYPYGDDADFLQRLVQRAHNKSSIWLGIRDLSACYLNSSSTVTDQLAEAPVRNRIIDATKRLAGLLFSVTCDDGKCSYGLNMAVASRFHFPSPRTNWISTTKTKTAVVDDVQYGILLDNHFLSIILPSRIAFPAKHSPLALVKAMSVIKTTM